MAITRADLETVTKTYTPARVQQELLMLSRDISYT
jgi:hypothetical protein